MDSKPEISNFSLEWDIHTHTVYSHGKGSIADNAEAASDSGLKILGIADHGPGHLGFGIRMRDIPSMRADIAECKILYPDLDIRLGVEANIINLSGRLDVLPEDFSKFDYILAGYHYGAFGEAPFKAFFMHAGGISYSLSGRSSARARNYNTEIVIRAVYENPIKILTHPGDKAEFDIGEIAEACRDRGTLMEINNAHRFLSVEGIREAAEKGASFVIGSDAHLPRDVGRFEKALGRAFEAGLSAADIVNVSERRCPGNRRHSRRPI